MCTEPDDLAAELDGPPVVDPDLLHAATDAVARLEHGHVGSGGGEVSRCGQPGQAGAEHEDVVQTVSSRSSTAAASAAAASLSTSPR